jgi:cytochrome c oxidase cbb3-type subunit 3
MSDFVSEFWSIYIAVITVASIVACGVLLQSMSSRRVAGSDVETTGHVWDEDLRELNHPLPRWWMWLFWVTLVFSAAYLVLYPGLGAFKGSYGWSSQKQYEEEQKQADTEYGPIFSKFMAQDLKQVAGDPQAQLIGQKLFLNYCAQCHGSDAGGAKGFPNLRDKDWLYGGEPEVIKASIMGGRNGLMPPMGQAVGTDQDVKDVAHYVLKLSGGTFDSLRAHRGKEKFESVCATCHTASGTGNPQLGAPNLTDKIWLHGGSEATIIETITRGRSSTMPANKDFLGEAKVHLLAAYVWSLSNNAAAVKGAAAAK